jgi:undecaprenyl diphosphate synthase
MDGNRRYARNKGVKVIQGHVDGFVALRRVRAQIRLQLCTVVRTPSKKNFLFFGGHNFFSNP